MPFGLFNTLASSQDCINIILIKKLNIFIIAYLDDTLIYNNEIDHVNFVWWFLE